MKCLDLIGKKFNKLAVIERIPNSKMGGSMWKCKCECGKEISVLGSNLKLGNTQSCGCLKKECIAQTKPPYYWLYSRLKCTANHNSKPISLTYEDFLSFTKITKCHYCKSDIVWMMYGTNRTSSAYYLDRKINESGYSKENCVVCCTNCNKVKSNHMSYDEMIKLGPSLKNIWKSRQKL